MEPMEKSLLLWGISLMPTLVLEAQKTQGFTLMLGRCT